MSRVFIVNDLSHDFDKASRHGELVYVTRGRLPIFKTDAVRVMLREKLKDFNIDEDFLLVTGPALVCIIATLLVVDGDKPIKLLVFDAKNQDYVVRHISV